MSKRNFWLHKISKIGGSEVFFWPEQASWHLKSLFGHKYKFPVYITIVRIGGKWQVAVEYVNLSAPGGIILYQPVRGQRTLTGINLQ